MTNPQLDSMIALYTEHVQGQREAQARIVQLRKELHEQEFAEKHHGEFLKALTPVLHRMDGGAQAMNEAMQGIGGRAKRQAEKIDKPAEKAADKPAEATPAVALAVEPFGSSAKRKG